MNPILIARIRRKKLIKKMKRIGADSPTTAASMETIKSMTNPIDRIFLIRDLRWLAKKEWITATPNGKYYAKTP